MDIGEFMSTTFPVLFIAFNRPEHTQKTLESLLVQHPQEIYVFQDGPRVGNEQDVVNCGLVRQVIEKLVRDTDILVHRHYSETNRGCRDAIIYAISSVLREREAVIVVEDDIITSPAFLSFMNQALVHYRERKGVFSISGFSHSSSRFAIPDDYDYDVYCSPRLFNWGWGTWADRWFLTDWSMQYFTELSQHLYEVDAFNRGGDDMMPMLCDEYNGRSSAWDIQFAYFHFYNHAVSIVPCQSYTYNIGCDGSGTHCNDTQKKVETFAEISALNSKTDIKFLDALYFDKRIINRQYNVFSRSKRPFYQRVINTLARLMGKQPPFSIKKKIFV